MHERVSKAVSSVRPSVIREMALRAAKLDNVISLGIGEPDFATSVKVSRQALRDAVRGATHYTPPQGDPELLEALTGHLQRRFGYRLQKHNILVTAGGMGALTAYFRTVLNPEDEVLVPEPYFPSYRPQIEWTGGKVVEVPTSFEEGFILDPQAVERCMTPRSKVLLVNYPHNPTGTVLPGPNLDDLAYLAREEDLLVVSDEVYDRLLYDGVRHESLFTRAGMESRTVVVGSFSKSFAMTGWRLGYALGPEWIIKEMTKVATYYTSCASSVSQRAALAALQQAPSISEAMVEQFGLRRELIYGVLLDLPGVRVHKPIGTFYIFPSLEDITDNTEEFALKLLEDERVVVIPGAAFGPSGVQCVRMAYTVDRPLLKEALERFSRFAMKRAS